MSPQNSTLQTPKIGSLRLCTFRFWVKFRVIEVLTGRTSVTPTLNATRIQQKPILT